MMKQLQLTLLITCLCFFTQLANAQTFEWAKAIVGNDYEAAEAVAVDATGNVYTTGYYYGTSTDLDPGPGVLNLGDNGGYISIYVQKLDALGNLIWAKSMGGGTENYGYDIAVDAAGNVYVTGIFQSTVDFDPGPGVFNMTTSGYGNFTLKLDASGNFVWAKKIGGGNLVVDDSGNVYLSGGFGGTVDFDPGPGTFNMTAIGWDTYICKLNTLGDFQWAKQLGGGSSSGTVAESTILDAAGNIYTVGQFNATADFDPSGAVFNMTPIGGYNGFVSKLDAAGNFVWAKNVGASSVKDVKVDASGGVYIAGGFDVTADFDPSGAVVNMTPTGSIDGFVSKLDAAGNFVWAKQLTSSASYSVYVNALALDPMNNVYSTGSFTDMIDLDPGLGTLNFTSTSNDNEIFVLKLDAMGELAWGHHLVGGAYGAKGNDIYVDPMNNIYTVGQFTGIVDFDPSQDSLKLDGASFDDAFIHKMSEPVLLPIIYVDINATGANNGSSWADAYTSLQEAIDSAAIGDTLKIAQGTYLPSKDTMGTTTTGREATFYINKDIVIRGGYPTGGGVSIPMMNQTILSGDLGIQSDNSDNSYNVIYLRNAPSSLILDGLIVQDGNANGSAYPYNRGGGIANNGMNSGNSSPTLQNCIFRWNEGTYGGAISNMSNFNGVVNSTITGCLFYENTSASGSAISNGTYQGGSNSSVITNCTFADNVGTSIHNSNGGATITIQNSIIWDFGAPLYNYGNESTVQYCLLKSGALPARTTDGGNNSFATYPQFVDATNDNYALKPFSTAVNRGSNGLLPVDYTSDLLGGTRIVNITVDLGATEAAASPAIIYVNHLAAGANNGTSWTDAYTSLKAGLDAANSGSSVWVAGGTYMPTGNADRTISFEIASGVKVYGGFAGGEGQLSQRDWATNPTILSGDLGAQGDPSDNSYNVVRLQNTDTTTTLDGLIVEYGNANGTPFPYNRGGGLSNNGMNSGNSSPTLQNCIFRWNEGTYGGAISNISNYNGAVNATITGCLFFENTSTAGSSINNSTYQGGNNNSVITNCTFADNIGTSIYNGNGGATITVQNSIIWDFGAPLYNYANEATVQYCNLKSGVLPARTIDGGNNMFATDPMFVDAVNDDYKLQGASPAVAAGSNGLLPAGYSLDLAYTTRQNGATVELGCYEDAVSTAKTMANNNPTTVDENTSAAEEQVIETPEKELEMSSLEEATTAINMTVYPNPVQDIVNIRLEGIQETVNLQLLNTAGQTIQQELLKIQEGQTIQLDMSRLTNGIYLLNLQLENGTRLNERVVKF
ncbi:MAG: T9SS type A sorting domain-containing protein [Aureispira sp.]|nr:T9SS type A sorting domain-containing protein [Aureispira sp.]